jgi:hypothetical protein
MRRSGRGSSGRRLQIPSRQMLRMRARRRPASRPRLPPYSKLGGGRRALPPQLGRRGPRWSLSPAVGGTPSPTFWRPLQRVTASWRISTLSAPELEKVVPNSGDAHHAWGPISRNYRTGDTPLCPGPRPNPSTRAPSSATSNLPETRPTTRAAAETGAASSTETSRGSTSSNVRPPRTTWPPRASTLRTQSEFSPYSTATASVDPRRKAITGVRYPRPERRPRWQITAHGGVSQAHWRWIGFVTTRLKRATRRGISTSRGYRPSAYASPLRCATCTLKLSAWLTRSRVRG